MFIVFNKQKIYSYIVALSTVLVLFVISFALVNNENNIITTSANKKELPIYSVKTDKKDIALTINCAW